MPEPWRLRLDPRRMVEGIAPPGADLARAGTGRRAAEEGRRAAEEGRRMVGRLGRLYDEPERKPTDMRLPLHPSFLTMAVRIRRGSC